MKQQNMAAKRGETCQGTVKANVTPRRATVRLATHVLFCVKIKSVLPLGTKVSPSNALNLH